MPADRWGLVVTGMERAGSRLELLVVEADRGLDVLAPDVDHLLDEGWDGPVVVHRAGRLTEAVEMLETVRPNCLIIDLELPDAAGLAAVLKLRNTEPHLPIVVLTDVDDDQLAADAVHAGAQDFLPRRFADARSLARSIRYAIERNGAEAFRSDQARVLEMIARGAGLSATLTEIAGLVERHGGGMLCGVYLSDDGRTLKVGAAPSLPPDYLSGVEGSLVGPTAGPGACVHRHQAVIAADIAVDDVWEADRASALTHGFRAAWATPILPSEGDHVLGALTLYFTEPRRPALDEQRLVEQAAHLAAIALERFHIQQQLSHAALHDALTGLPNRNLFMDRLALALARAKRRASHPGATLDGTVAVLFLDLDKFKDVNDTLGHEAGDELLICAADRLRRAIRPSDTVARFGGDEFVVLCDGLNEQIDAGRIAGRLSQAFATPFHLGGQEVRIGASIGIAIVAPELCAADDLLRAADTAMYRAKVLGPGGWELHGGGLPGTTERRVVEQQLRRALVRSTFHPAVSGGSKVDHHLVLAFQPIVSLADGELAGMEALVRWSHPERGLIAAAEIIGVAESCDLVVPIDRWVLRETCLQLRRWHDGSYESWPLTVCVKVSDRTLQQFDYAGFVIDVLEETGIDASWLCLEVPERVVSGGSETYRATIAELRRHGVNVAIDGFSAALSIATLVAHPVDALKIDPVLVAQLLVPESSVSAQRTVKASIDLAHSFGMVAMAEGVEAADQRDVLRRLGCDCVQGVMFGMPALVDGDIDLNALQRAEQGVLAL